MESVEDGEGKTTEFFSCKCFTTDNIFLEDYKIHVRFESEEQFRRDFRPRLLSLGCNSEEKFKDVLEKISKEVQRRSHLDEASAQRCASIKKLYKPLRPDVYTLKESYLSPKFNQIVKYCRKPNATKEGLLELLGPELAQKVYRFPVFEKSFCNHLMEELEHFEKSPTPKERPNTMKHEGFILHEMGLDESLIIPFREQYLQHITSLLYPECGGSALDSHKAFVVKYDLNGDLDLSYHYDNSEVTINICLGKEFKDGCLYFGDMRQVPLSESLCCEVEHEVTQGIIHRGQQMHGALPILSGQRWNLVIWMRASRERNKLCPMCNRKPSLVHGKRYAEGFT